MNEEFAMTIAVTGATGQLGRLALAALQARAPQARVIALARNPGADPGLPTRAFDYTSPETMASALPGVDVLVLISSNDFNDRAGQHKAFDQLRETLRAERADSPLATASPV